MDYEYASDEQYGGRVLWGRVAVYGVSLLLAFILGSCVGGRGQVPQSDLEAANAEIAALAEENETYERQLDALSSNAADRPRVPAEGEDVEGAEDGTVEGETTEGETTEGEAGAGETRTYTVQDSDTLYVIAQRMYGDGNKFNLIAEANNLDSTTRLRVGQELVIPPDS